MLLNLVDLLKVANEKNFAVPAFNIGTGQILNGVIDECEELNAPVILAIHPLELEFQGDSFMKMCLDRVHNSFLPIAVHLDHGRTMEEIYRGIRVGFSSVMIDASHLPFAENVALTKQVVDIAHELGISVEGELGTIGVTDGDREGGSHDIIYTDPDDAVRFVEETGVDALAVAIGTCHGLYPEGFKAEIKLDLLTEIKKKVHVPLVLHGGSSNPDKEIAESVKRGMNKINISSDIKDALYQDLRQVLTKDMKVREPFDLYPHSIEVMRKVVRDKVKLFNDDDKVKYYKVAASQ